MDLDLGSAASIRRFDSVAPATRLTECIVLTVTTLLCLLATTMIVRRLAGALVQPLDAGPLLVTAVLLATTAAALRAAWQWLPTATRPVGLSWLVWTLPSLALLAFAFALSLPGTSIWPLRALWGMLAIEEAMSLFRVWRNMDDAQPADAMPAERVQQVEPVEPVDPLPTEVERVTLSQPPARGKSRVVSLGDRDLRFDPPQQPAPHILPPNASQQITRAFEDDGSDVLYGLLRGHFAPGQRALRLHVSFCPPFDTVPEVTVEPLEGPELTVRPGQILPYGLRLDLRLKALHADPQDVVLELFVRGDRTAD